MTTVTNKLNTISYSKLISARSVYHAMMIEIDLYYTQSLLFARIDRMNAGMGLMGKILEARSWVDNL